MARTGRSHTPPNVRAKIFTNGRSQAVRLPREFRFEGKEVVIRKEGDAVILEPVANRRRTRKLPGEAPHQRGAEGNASGIIRASGSCPSGSALSLPNSCNIIWQNLTENVVRTTLGIP